MLSFIIRRLLILPLLLLICDDSDFYDAVHADAI